jgi:uncharacterized membrane protein
MRPRIHSVDLVRGLVMVIMAIDHVRDFFNAYTQHASPEDLSQTTTAMFLTRWITHFCAPTFVFLAGTSASLTANQKTTAQIAQLLVTRGAWLVVVELTLVSFGLNFNLSYRFVLLQVIWAIGWSMIVLAALIHLPWRVLLPVSLAIVAGHNLLDPIRAERFGGMAWLWTLLHGGPTFIEWAPGYAILSGYALIPWLGVMMAGYCFGRLYRDRDATRLGHEGPLVPAEKRQAVLLGLGLALTALFVTIRFVNGYGDPAPWSVQTRAGMTPLSFLATTKYPPSLDYVLMTLGPSIFLLGLLDRVTVRPWHPLLVFGSVPFFYYLCHLFLLHGVAVVLAWFRYHRVAFLFQLMPSFNPAATGVPPEYGYSLGMTYVIWACIVAALYPLCLWYSKLKARHKSPVFSYL